ncbi:hypothetical protein A3F00_01090 [Candidatus Daviesbacteria bacterium RIFCSPHIGHO2_12_FULL_37_11]|uniref:Glycosyltransferase RgtA/B/C/D-like domain-containing protein n=1 Tax=Candidatus Daviesbacteria bacterium RIFCSPHIGHO2_12_FULL_37_11 TaxID=1797777 RepID=A0A1F5K9B8_9BACT|nr:MAG: hypothetical protein A2769_00060 [Candidatus Daviesbacteria bacterium RIFCSPHIGHO2_01_FULL_37_27]OGE37444.1 MAG: hypothetical protein A3F00_01090 [Candidatus Daviesbacteria bacterium RIFCSPHIGHO2_12_FULL_37_11]OGE44732.1 MAG: hypothetical protein A3B39_01460 [Candidatus Daviesbacteria bacterium RIFCSPLOWO2_01_FULL_37_10]
MQKFWKTNEYFYLIIILLIACLLRFYGINWDQNQHLHPDERFLTMVTQAIRWPSSIPEYFSTSTSPLNPHNQNFPFYVYGTFPLFLIKALSDITGLTDYNQITILGRFISGLFDIAIILLVFLIGRRVFSSSVGLLAAFFYSVSVIPIQLSHFYAVDTFLNFFLTLTIYFLIKSIYSPKIIHFILAGISLGFAFASKVSAFLIGPPIILVFVYLLYHFRNKVFIWIGLFLSLTLLIFRVMQPYAFTGTSIFDFSINPKFIANLTELQAFSKPGNYFPPAVQWNNTLPIIYPLKELFIWGLGIPAGIITIIAFVTFLIKLLKNIIKSKLNILRDPSFITRIVLTLVILTIFVYQGVQFAKPLRYFYPMLPALIIITSYFITEVLSKLTSRNRIIYFVFLILIWSIWSLSFMSIYSRDHSRVQASEWIYQNIPAGSSISAEHWDDALPLNIQGNSSNIYQFVEFPLYAKDTDEKWTEVAQKLKEVDYIILSSNRLYGGITRNLWMYPATSKYYQDLFSSKLGFEKIAEFTSRPSIPVPGISICLILPFSDYGEVSKKYQECEQGGIVFVDDYIDETNTVYDHPKIIIFKKYE